MVRPARFERTAFGSGGQRSIQLSYGRTRFVLICRLAPAVKAACVRGFRDSAQAPSVGTQARWMGQKNGRSRKATHVQAGEGAKQSWAARRCLHGASLSGMHEQGDWRASPAALVVITENHHVRHSFTAMRNNTMRNNTMRNNTMRPCGGKPASPHGGGTDARSFCA